MPRGEVLITRWRRTEASIAVGPVRDPDHARLIVAMVATDATLRVDDTVVHEGRLPTGTVQILAPGQCVRATYRMPVDFVRLHIPRRVFDEMAAGSHYARVDPRWHARPLHDPVIERLATTMCEDASGNPAAPRLLDAVGAAMLARAGAMLAVAPTGRAGTEKPHDRSSVS